MDRVAIIHTGQVQNAEILIKFLGAPNVIRKSDVSANYTLYNDILNHDVDNLFIHNLPMPEMPRYYQLVSIFDRMDTLIVVSSPQDFMGRYPVVPSANVIPEPNLGLLLGMLTVVTAFLRRRVKRRG